jgi:predicted component of type VI protein secretion system
MPYLIITDKQQELDRHELKGPVVLGRSAECDVVVRDVLLSRRHLKIEPLGDRWVVSDMGSKNGTFVEGQSVDRYLLNDADIVRAGRTRIIFRSGPFQPPPPDVAQRKASRRPSDPIEALSGTMLGFELTDMEQNSRATGFPIPRPKPVEPAGYHRENVHGMVTQMATSSGQYDLALREAPPPRNSAAPDVTPAREVIAREEDIRSGRDPANDNGSAEGGSVGSTSRSATPRHPRSAPRWLALVLIFIGYVLCALILWFLSWR